MRQPAEHGRAQPYRFTRIRDLCHIDIVTYQVSDFVIVQDGGCGGRCRAGRHDHPLIQAVRNIAGQGRGCGRTRRNSLRLIQSMRRTVAMRPSRSITRPTTAPSPKVQLIGLPNGK